MSFKLTRNLQGFDLRKERLKGFKRVVICEVFVILLALLLPGSLKAMNIENYILVSELVFPTFLMFMIVLWWDMLRTYTSSKSLIVSLLVLMVSIFLSNIILLNPVDPLLKGDAYNLFSFLLMLFMIALEVLLIWAAIVEIFKNRLPVKENLLGAVFVYLTTGIAFASIYTILAIFQDIRIENLPDTSIYYQYLMGYSFMILGGIDNPYPEFSELAINISAIESVIGNLFIVFVVGRLFTQQGVERDENES